MLTSSMARKMEFFHILNLKKKKINTLASNFLIG